MLEKSAVRNIISDDRVYEDEVTLEQFSRDQSFVPSRRPDLVVYPETVEEIQAASHSSVDPGTDCRLESERLAGFGLVSRGTDAPRIGIPARK